jgi:hypothetical protein
MTSEDEEVEDWKLPAKFESELKLALAGELITSPELEKALAGDIGAVEFVWRSIASGTANLAECHIWVETIAKRIVADVIPTDARKRHQAANKAIGFSTFLDEHWAARNDLEVFDSFRMPEGEIEPCRREVANWLMGRGHFGGPPPSSASAAKLKAKEEYVMRIVSQLRKQIAESQPVPPPKD